LAVVSRAPVSREELLDSYRDPYRRWLPSALRGYGVHHLAGLTVLLGAAGGIGAAVDAGFADTALALALAGVGAVVLVAIWALAVGVRVIRERTQQWRADRTDELAQVRELRPHRAEADIAIAHVEYAALEAEDGTVTTWAFEPLLAGDDADEDSVLIAGIPRYEAHVVERLEHDATGEAQARAAALEADEIVRARLELELEHDSAALELPR
jgi:hypothetical protein